MTAIWRTDGAGLVIIWNDNGAYISVWRSVFERHAPVSIKKIESIVAPQQIGQGNYVRPLSGDLLRALTDAYRKAATNSGKQGISS